MRELIHTSVRNDNFRSFTEGAIIESDRRRLGNMYTNKYNYASRIQFTTDNQGAAKISFTITCAVWIPYSNTHNSDSDPSNSDTSDDEYLIYDANGNASQYITYGNQTYSLQNSFKFAIVSEEQKNALTAWTASVYADSQAKADAALDEAGYIIKNCSVRVSTAKGQVNNQGDTLTAADAKETAMMSGECEVLLAPNTTYYIWLYSTFDQTWVVRPFAFTGYWDEGQVIVSIDGAYGPHWMESSLYLYANNQWNSIN